MIKCRCCNGHQVGLIYPQNFQTAVRHGKAYVAFNQKLPDGSPAFFCKHCVASLQRYISHCCGLLADEVVNIDATEIRVKCFATWGMEVNIITVPIEMIKVLTEIDKFME